MILLYDSKTIRADITISALPGRVYLWRDNAWRNSDGVECTPAPEDFHWLLMHDSDIETDFFKDMELKQQSTFDALKCRVRFTGGNPTGKPESEYWVQYRLVSESDPFTKEELEALDQWVRNGCNLEERPWLLFEEKPHHLRGLLILLQVAEIAASKNRGRRGESKQFDVELPTWWKERLNREDDWESALRGELSRRTSNPGRSHALENFINWVKGSVCDGNSYRLFDQVSPENSQTQLAALIAMLRECV